jgi:hypothetical protein
MRIWIKGEPCYDQEPIQAYIMDLEKEIKRHKARITELESWLKSFHGTPEDVAGYEKLQIKSVFVKGVEVYGLDPNTPSGLPMIPSAKEKK